MGAPVLHDPTDCLEGKGLEIRKPDRVVDLARTKALQDKTSTRQQLRHSPFGDDNVLYLFLIVEGRSEIGSPGFHSIENQTDVPIITVMKLQQNLFVSDRPVAWFNLIL